MKQAFRFLLVLTWLTIGVSFTSCDKDKNNDATETETSTSDTDTETETETETSTPDTDTETETETETETPAPDTDTEPTIEMEDGYSYYRVTNTTSDTIKFWVGGHNGHYHVIMEKDLAKEVYIFKVRLMEGSTIILNVGEGYYLYYSTGYRSQYYYGFITEATKQYSYGSVDVINKTLQDIEIGKD